MGQIQKLASLGMATVLTMTSYIGVSAAPFSNLSHTDVVAQIVSEASPQALQVQYRRFGPPGPPVAKYRHYGPPGPQAWHYGPPYPGRGYRDDTGAAIALGIFGMILGGMLATEAQRQDAINYCAQRFQSYDPQSMTYLGYDGLRHPCP